MIFISCHPALFSFSIFFLQSKVGREILEKRSWLKRIIPKSFNTDALGRKVLVFDNLGMRLSQLSASRTAFLTFEIDEWSVYVVSFQLCSDAMRLILVKPTNATRRLDSTGEVFHDGDHAHCTSGGPSRLTKSPEGVHDRLSGSSVEASSSPQETSLCCVSSSPHERSNGISPPTVSGQMSPLKTRNLTLSQLSDQDWLLLCGQVSSVGDDSPSAERAGASVGHPNHSDRCGCSCLDVHRHSDASSFHPHSKRGTVQDCLSRVSNKRRLSSSPQTQLFSQCSQAPATCQVLPQQTNQRDLLKPATNHPQDNLMLQCREQEGRKELSQPCDHSKFKDAGQANLFNIPLNSIGCADTNQKHLPQPAVPADVNWRELFGKEPLLVQQCQTHDSNCSMSGDQTCKSEDPSVVLKCRHLPYKPLTSAPRVKRSSTPASNKSVQSFSISQYSSLDNQDLVEERARQRQCQVIEFLLASLFKS